MENDSFKVNVKSYAGKLSLYYIFLLFFSMMSTTGHASASTNICIFIQPLQINEIIYPDT